MKAGASRTDYNKAKKLARWWVFTEVKSEDHGKHLRVERNKDEIFKIVKKDRQKT